MRTHKDSVIVIKAINYGEADKIITVFGKQKGKFTLIAKGLRRLTSKNRGNMQTFSLSSISYYKGEGMPILLETQGEYISDFVGSNPKDFERVLILINKYLAEEQKNLKIYNALKEITRKGISRELVNRFRVLFLIEEGFLPNMDICSICGRSEDLEYLNLKEISLVCKECGKTDKSLVKLNGNIYESDMLTNALDNYIDKNVEGVA